MRYFKYKKTNTIKNAALKIQYAQLSKDEKRLVRKEKALNIISTIVFFAVSVSALICSAFAIEQISKPEGIIFAILYYIGIVILGIIAIGISLLIGSLACLPFLRNVDTSKRALKQNILSQACAELREFYELQEPCLVTKCYESNDKKFTNHDVCIFIVGDELRITANLKHGFFHEKTIWVATLLKWMK